MDIRALAVLSFFVALLASYLSTPLVIRFAWKFGLIDDPNTNKHPKKIHKKPIPRAGGLSPFLALVVASMIFLPIDKHLIGIIAGAFIIVLLGIADDKWVISPYLRLALQFLAAAAPIAAGIGISFISNPMGGIIDLSHPRIVFDVMGHSKSIWVLSDIFALFWIVTLMNFVNHGAKGVAGQLPGVVAIAAITIAFLSLRFSADITQWPVIVLAFITAGSYIGFLPYNFYPQKIMPAMSGSNLGGYLLGVLSILSTTKVGTLTVVLGIPLIDTFYTIIRRVLSGKSPVWGDVGHLHHRLMRAGWSPKKVAYFYWGSTTLLGILALSLNTKSKLYTIFGISLILAGLIIWLAKKNHHSQ